MINRPVKFITPLPGFKTIFQYTLKELIHLEQQLFYELSSEEGVGLLLVDPFHIKKSYEVKLPKEILEKMNIVDTADVVIFSIVTVQEPFEHSTVNLRAPIIINLKESLGYQWIRNDHQESIKHPLKSYSDKEINHADIK